MANCSIAARTLSAPPHMSFQTFIGLGADSNTSYAFWIDESSDLNGIIVSGDRRGELMPRPGLDKWPGGSVPSASFAIASNPRGDDIRIYCQSSSGTLNQLRWSQGSWQPHSLALGPYPTGRVRPLSTTAAHIPPQESISGSHPASNLGETTIISGAFSIPTNKTSPPTPSATAPAVIQSTVANGDENPKMFPSYPLNPGQIASLALPFSLLGVAAIAYLLWLLYKCRQARNFSGAPVLPLADSAEDNAIPPEWKQNQEPFSGKRVSRQIFDRSKVRPWSACGHLKWQETGWIRLNYVSTATGSEDDGRTSERTPSRAS